MGLNGLSNPSSDALSNKYVETEHRGRFNSLYSISKILGTVLASCFVAWGVISNNTIILFVILTLFYCLQYLAILKIDYKPEKKSSVFKESINYLVHSKSRYKIIYALITNHIIEKKFVPLYLYLLLKDFKAFSVVIIVSLLFQGITIILIGKYTDKNIKKSNNLVTLIKTGITLIYLFAKDKFVISVNKTVSDNISKVYDTSIQTSIQNIIKDQNENKELLAAVGQMSLCFTEVIVLVELAILSCFIGEKVFIVIFILSIISTLCINYNIKRESAKECE